MACNDLGFWAFNDSSSIDLCFSSLTINLYGENISVGETLYSGATCVYGSDEIGEGYFSNNIIYFRYLGGVRTPSSCICENNYCVDGTSTYDDTYSLSGIYDEDSYYSGNTLPYVIYYSSGTTQWCLSTSLGGICSLFGPTGSFSSCPDLHESLFYEGSCTTTTSTIDPCFGADFDAIFNCLITPTPTTPLVSTTPTPTPTPTPTSSNTFIVEIGGLKTTPLPSYSPTPTPTPTPQITRPCVFSGSVTFNTINEIMNCVNSKKFKDCFTGLEYYTTQILFDPSGNTISEGYVYSTYINGIGICATFDGLVDNISGIDNIQIVGLIGPFNQGGCIDCIPPTPDPILECLIINSECGIINVNPSTFINGKLSYTWKFPGLPQYTYQIYWDYSNNVWVCKEMTTNLVGCQLNIDSEIPIGSISEWVYFDTSNPSTNCIEELSGFNTTLLSVPCPSPTPTPTPTPTPFSCILYEYRITNNSISSIKYSYKICEGKIVSVNIPMYSSTTICASETPLSSQNIDVDFIGIC